MSEIGGTCDNHPAGTLLWIGDRQSAEFQEPYQYCESRVAQLALRRDLRDAIARPAAAVRCILVARRTRQPADAADGVQLARRFPNAKWVYLLGTLCEGDRSRHLDRTEMPMQYWHQWNQFLPRWLEPCIAHRETQRRDSRQGSVRSVAVVASSASTADPFMELVASAGAAAIWCRRPDSFRARNFDAVWWDDSVAKPTTARRWRERLNRARSSFGQVQPHGGTDQQHAWIVQSPRIEHYRQAKAAGVDLVLSKPGQINCLSEMLAANNLNSRTDRESDRRAQAA